MDNRQFQSVFDAFEGDMTEYDFSVVGELTNLTKLKVCSLLKCKIIDESKNASKTPYDSSPLMLVLGYNAKYLSYINLNHFSRKQLRVIMGRVMDYATSFNSQKSDLSSKLIIDLFASFGFSSKRIIRKAYLSTVRGVKHITDDFECVKAIALNDNSKDMFVFITREQYRRNLK